MRDPEGTREVKVIGRRSFTTDDGSHAAVAGSAVRHSSVARTENPAPRVRPGDLVGGSIRPAPVLPGHRERGHAAKDARGASVPLRARRGATREGFAATACRHLEDAPYQLRASIVAASR